HEDRSIDLFADVSEGEVLTQMNGTAQSLIERAGRVATLACASGRISKNEVVGALMVYCGGCMLSVQDNIGEVAAGVDDALDGAPFLGTFTFGEQGSLLQAGNRHGNLMISCIVFGSE
ncbi:MAG: FIST C-terminal domain-containing protein, partial [Pseudomonadota bacterium]